MDIQRFEKENITKSGFACVRDILTDRLLVTSDSCDLLNEQYQKILDLQSQLDQQKAMWNELKEWAKDLLKGCDLILDRQQINNDLYNRSISQKRIIINMLSKMQELEQGGKNEN